MTETWKYKIWLKTEINNRNQLLRPTSAHTCFVRCSNGNHLIFNLQNILYAMMIAKPVVSI